MRILFETIAMVVTGLTVFLCACASAPDRVAPDPTAAQLRAIDAVVNDQRTWVDPSTLF